VIYSRAESCPECLLVEDDPMAHRWRKRYGQRLPTAWLRYEDKDGHPWRRFCPVCGAEWRWHGRWLLVKEPAFVYRGLAGEVKVRERYGVPTVRR